MGKKPPNPQGKQLIVQMIVGGTTQFLTKAQRGMPPEIEQRLAKRIRTFIWDHVHVPPISMTTLSKPTLDGGLNILDLKVRNKAIQAFWLKSYLQLDESRPSWAFIADELFTPASHTDM
jgi:hypothetical protein